MHTNAFDNLNRFVLRDYASLRPFASFLPGIAGPDGIPLWVFYVNRGQAIASFGVHSKDHPIVEFQPANKAYQQTAYLGFRTFVKLGGEIYEPFSPFGERAESRRAASRRMAIGMNELELEETDAERGLSTRVLYFTVPHENFAALARQVTLTNTSAKPLAIQVLDGLPALIPSGVSNGLLKDIHRTIEAWMEVFNLEARAPFFRLRATPGDTAEVGTIEAGNFALAALEQGGTLTSLPALVDPAVVFGSNSSLSLPNGFAERELGALVEQPQITVGRTPCAFFGAAFTLAKGQSVTLHSLYGHANRMEHLTQVRERLMRPGYLDERIGQARNLTDDLTSAMATRTSSERFDAYCRQTFLDNVLRGGWPLVWGDDRRPNVYHIYSRKHGDLERDYNAFVLAPEPYSQGNGNFRDVNQNRRCDVLFEPRVGDFNVRAFMMLIQADGYNPLVIQGSTFTLAPKKRAEIAGLAEKPVQLAPLFEKPFTPGRVMRFIHEQQVALRVSSADFIDAVMSAADQHLEASFTEGYWADHWTYNLDMIESFLAVYPDRKAALLFEDGSLPFFESPVSIQPRDKRYVLANGKPRQFNALLEDEEKAAHIAARESDRNWLRTHSGEVYRTTVFAKLVSLVLNKFATLDPSGMAVEMEGGRPGWYDALNGLPGLFGSSMPETFELARLIGFLRQALRERGEGKLLLPIEMMALLREVKGQLQAWNDSKHPERDFQYWDSVNTARESYHAAIHDGFRGETEALAFAELEQVLQQFADKVQRGIERALEFGRGVPPTYFMHEVEAYEALTLPNGEARCDEQGRVQIRPTRFKPVALPLFLEGPVRAYRVLKTPEAARKLYSAVRASSLFDQKLKMYKVNASLAEMPTDIGRARAFPPGWLENESIWLHMEYKYLLEVLRAGLYEEFFSDMQAAMVPFLDPKVYGRSPLENSSFIASSAYPDAALHGAGFVARLSGSTAEFLSIWNLMFAGAQPFVFEHNALAMELCPRLPGFLFTEEGRVTFKFLGTCEVTYHNPKRVDTFASDVRIQRLELHEDGAEPVVVEGARVGAPYAERVRRGKVSRIDAYLDAD